MTKITPVLMAGGSGTRLWPASRKSFPKQFAPLVGARSLFQAAASRLVGDDFEKPMIVTNAAFRFIVAEQLELEAVEARAIVIEPSSRNTAPAVLAASKLIAADDPDALILALPADHVITDKAAFAAAVKLAARAANDGKIVTFGVVPDRPETGYGYLELADTESIPSGLVRFVEKPDAAAATDMVASGKYLWNAGIFLFRASVMIQSFHDLAPEFIEPVEKAVNGAKNDLGFIRLDSEAWNECPDTSIDYAVMEKARHLAVVPCPSRWNDLGGWDAVWREMLAEKPHSRGIVADDNSTAIDCENVLLRSESRDIEVIGIGLENIVVVATNDAVLVADKSRSQDVRKAVKALQEKGRKQATSFLKDRRPWGWYETLALEDRFQVKRIVVKPGAALSLQSHVHRSEHWIVVSGTAKVTVDDKVSLITENQSIYVPLGAIHRMENPGKVPMVLVEVQTGSYLGEDDIIRYEDAYSRDKSD